ncbi:MAG: hypothetical protein AB6733_22965 [Clostridiaceae bacterium]
MLRKKKKGSTMVTVVAIFGILTIVGTVTLSLTLSGFKLRNLESSKIENQYSAEAGIDETKKIVEIAVDSSIKKANMDVYEENKILSSQLNKVKEQSNGTLSDIKAKISTIISSKGSNYQVFLKDENSSSTDDSNIYYYYTDKNGDNKPRLNMKEITEKQSYFFAKSFKKTLSDNIPKCIKIDDDGNYIYNNLKFNDKNQLELNNINLTNEAKVKLVDFKQFDEHDIKDISVKTIPVKLQSTFDTAKKVNGIDQKIEKVIETQFTINVPDLTNKNIAKNPLLQKAISNDGNIFVNSDLTINGDLFNLGTPKEDVTDVVFDKYDSGIFVNVDKDELTGGEATGKSQVNVNFNGNVVTYGTLNVKQSGNVTVSSGNLYANNVNLGRLKPTDNNVSDNSLKVKTSMIVDNDLTYNCKASELIIHNLYAVNEIRDLDSDANKKSKNSSSLIINSDMSNSKDKITIENDAYIVGTSYINTSGSNGSYQTGESISVKGNAYAYSSPIDDGNEYEFNEYGSFQLVDTMTVNGNKKKMDYNDKAKYFVTSANANPDNIDKGEKIALYGDLSNIYIMGAFLNKGQVKQQITLDDAKESVVINKRKEFANQVYEMGNYDSSGDVNGLTKSYNNRVVNKKVSNLIDVDELTEIKGENNNYIAVVHKKNSSSDKLKLSNSDIDGIDINGKYGVIVTDADIEITGDVNFKGTIITTGNIITDGGSINISYNGDAIQKVITDFNLENIFSKALDFQLSGIEGKSGEGITSSDYIDNNYWKIVK